MLPVGTNQALAQWQLNTEALSHLRAVSGACDHLQLQLRVSAGEGGTMEAVDVSVSGAEGVHTIRTQANGPHSVVATIGARGSRGLFHPAASSEPVTVAGPPIPPPAVPAPPPAALPKPPEPKPESAKPLRQWTKADAPQRDLREPDDFAKPERNDSAPKSPVEEAPKVAPASHPTGESFAPRRLPVPRHPLIVPPDDGGRLSALAHLLLKRDPARLRPSSGQRIRPVSEQNPGGNEAPPELVFAASKRPLEPPTAPPRTNCISEHAADKAARRELQRRGIALHDVAPPEALQGDGLVGTGCEWTKLLVEDQSESNAVPAGNAGFAFTVTPAEEEIAADTAVTTEAQTVDSTPEVPAWPSGQPAAIQGVEAIVRMEGRLMPGYDLWLFGEPVMILTEGRISVQHTFEGVGPCLALLDQLAPGPAEPLLTVVPHGGVEPILTLEASLHLHGTVQDEGLRARLANRCEIAKDGRFAFDAPLPQGALLLSGLILVPQSG